MVDRIIISLKERARKAEQESARLREELEKTKATQDYNIMMGNIEDPGEEEEDEVDG